jgi:hypothetical protein
VFSLESKGFTGTAEIKSQGKCVKTYFLSYVHDAFQKTSNDGFLYIFDDLFVLGMLVLYWNSGVNAPPWFLPDSSSVHSQSLTLGLRWWAVMQRPR